MSKDQTRYVLNGICIEARNAKELVLVGTDGRVLVAALHECAQEHGLKKGDNFIMPDLLIHRTLATPKNEVEIALENSRITTQTFDGISSMAITMQVVDGKFPNWRQISGNLSELVPSWSNCVGTQALEPIIAAKRMITGYKEVFLQPYRQKHPNTTRPSYDAHYVQLDTKAVGIFMPSRSNDAGFAMPLWATEPLEEQP